MAEVRPGSPVAPQFFLTPYERWQNENSLNREMIINSIAAAALVLLGAALMAGAICAIVFGAIAIGTPLAAIIPVGSLCVGLSSFVLLIGSSIGYEAVKMHRLLHNEEITKKECTKIRRLALPTFADYGPQQLSKGDDSSVDGILMREQDQMEVITSIGNIHGKLEGKIEYWSRLGFISPENKDKLIAVNANTYKCHGEIFRINRSCLNPLATKQDQAEVNEESPARVQSLLDEIEALKNRWATLISKEVSADLPFGPRSSISSS